MIAGNINNCISFIASPETKTRIAIYKGNVDNKLFLESYERLINSPDFDSTLNDIVDLRGVVNLDITTDGFFALINMLSKLDRYGYQTKVAIVAPTDMTLGMGRMYEQMRGSVQNSTEIIRVFRNYYEAVRWL